MKTLNEQMMTEEAAFHGDLERALSHLVAASELLLVDLDWLDRCPLLEPLRERPSFLAARGRVQARCEEIWSVMGKTSG